MLTGAEESLRSASTRCPGKKEIEEELQRVRVLSAHLAEGERALSGGEPARALEMYAAALKVTQCAAVQLGCARAEIALGRCDGAMRTTAAVIRAEPGNVRAYAARGHALCLKLDFDQGMKHVREGLRLDPDHAECASLFRRMKRAGAALDRGRTAAGTRDFEAAAIAFTESLDAAQAPTHSPFTAAVLAQRANARLRLKEYDAALVDCAAAIASQEDHKPAYFTQSTALLHLGKPQEAADSLKVLLEMDPGDETVRCVSFLFSFSFYHPLNVRAIRLTSRVFVFVHHRRHHEKATFEVRKSKRPDYYAILGISRVASVPEVKQAYKQRCMEWHPDRHANSSDEDKAAAERNFKLLGEALEVMEDTMKRQLYDEGFDKEAIAERVEAARRAAHRGGYGNEGTRTAADAGREGAADQEGTCRRSDEILFLIGLVKCIT